MDECRVRNENGKKLFLLLFFVLFIFSGCAAGGGSPRLLTEKIRSNYTEVRRYLILGDGVSPEDAKRLAQQANAYAVYSPPKGALAELTKKALTKTLGPSAAMKGAMEDLRAMGESGQPWEILVTEHAKNYFLTILHALANKELNKVQGSLLFPDTLQGNQEYEREIRRVFGEGIKIEYVSNE